MTVRLLEQLAAVHVVVPAVPHVVARPPCPTPIPFPTDRHSLLRCVRSYLDLLTLRVDGGIEDEAGCDYALPGGLSLDGITCSLMAYAADDDANSAAFGLEPYSEQDDVEEIVASVRRLLDRAGPPGAN